MGSGRKRLPPPAEEEGHASDGGSKKKQKVLPSSIRNKEKRAAVHAELKREKKVEKRKKAKLRDAAEKKALELGESVSEKQCLFLIAYLFAFGLLLFYICTHSYLLLSLLAAAPQESSSNY